ncbi:MAG: C40 family peptidase [Sphingobacteriia bacterium]|jgi:cell wall-associated NlpC family hydrolase
MPYDLRIATERIVPLRAEARHASELVSQLFLFEPVVVLAQVPDWLQLRSLWDDYTGWAPAPMLGQPEAADPWLASTWRVVPHTLPVLRSLAHSPQPATPVLLECGAALPPGLPQHFRLGQQQFQLPAVHLPESPYGTAIEAGLCYLNAPYLWGGKTEAGIDCSGLVQMAYRLCGQWLPRDAWQQAEVCSPIAYELRQPGDLAFFCNDRGRITHVGMVLENGEILHASQRVRIDQLTPEGIFAYETQHLTHRLATVARPPKPGTDHPVPGH